MADELGIEPSGYLTSLEQQILEQASDLGGLDDPPPVRTVTTTTRNPYKGLRAFDETDARDFFGREELVRRLVERIESRHRSRLTVLAGASGAGKSSVVRAGLIPELRDRDNAVAVMTPGRDPVVSLAHAISDELGRDVAGIDSGSVAVSSIGDVVVVVDQAEELFTAAADQDSAETLLNAMSEEGTPVRWVLTIRADYLDRLLAHPKLGDQLEEALVLVPRLQDHEVAAAVRKPAEGVGLAVADDLTRKIIDAVHEEPSALPLLQYGLTDTFDRRRSDTLTLADFELAGGISGALSRRAEEQFRVLGNRREKAAKRLFLTLTTVTGNDDIVRRRVPKADLYELAEPGVMEAVIDRFNGLRLLVFDQDPESGEATVEIAHEELFRQWPRLSEWVEESRDDLRMRRRLEAATAEWENSGRENDFLLSGGRLAEFVSWRERSEFVLEDNEFLSYSQQRAVATARRRRIRRVALATSLAAAALIAGVLAVESNRQASLATVRELVAASSANVSSDPDLALLLALEAHARGADVAAPEIAQALHAAVQAQRALLIRPSGGLSFFSPDGTKFIGAVRLRSNDLRSFHRQRRASPHRPRRHRLQRCLEQRRKIGWHQ